MSPTKYPSTKKRKKTKRRRSNLPAPLLLALAGLLVLVWAGFSLLGGRNSAGPKADFEPEVTGSPALRVDQEVIDFGKVRMDVPVQATFTLTNAGDQTLRFSKQPYIEVLEGC